MEHAAAGAASEGDAHRLACTPETVCWGYMDASVAPRLTVPSGARVVVDCMDCGGPAPPGAPRPELPQSEWVSTPEHADIWEKVIDRMEPGHILTGPIYIEGACCGDVLRIDIEDIALRSNWAWTSTFAYGGALAEPLPSKLNYTLLEAGSADPSQPGAGWAFPAWGGRLDLRPFFGVLSTAPPPELGRQSSIPPRNLFGGNLDCKELVAGTTLFLPVNVDGALLFVGDGHARQGDGECCGTALETALQGTFKLTVIKAGESGDGAVAVKAPLTKPRAETPSAIIAMAIDDQSSLQMATSAALNEMLDWLGELKPSLSRQDAYCLLSVAGDVRVTQLVNNPTRGAHVVLEKASLEGLGEAAVPPVPPQLACQPCAQ